MDRRAFLSTAGIGATTLAFPAVLRAQSKDPVRIGCPLPLSGPFAALAKDMQQGAQLANLLYGRDNSIVMSDSTGPLVERRFALDRSVSAQPTSRMAP
jgi:hypothetical protein